jgi:hypothetical protein
MHLVKVPQCAEHMTHAINPGLSPAALFAAQGQSSEALRGITKVLDAAAAEAETSLAPIARRQAEQAQRQLQQLEHQWKEAASDYERSSRSQQQGRSRQSRHRAASSNEVEWE